MNKSELLSDPMQTPDPRIPANQYAALFDAVAQLLLAADPMNLGIDENVDEYDVETTAILELLPSATSLRDVELIVYDVFGRSFDPENAGPFERYVGIAREIWGVKDAFLRG
jgi:hypothetical protein